MVYQEFFYPLCASAPLMDGGVSVPQRVIPAGSITVPSGRLVVIDPVTGEDTSPAVAVPPGTYPVVATVAQAPYPGKKPQELLSYLSVPHSALYAHTVATAAAIARSVLLAGV